MSDTTDNVVPMNSPWRLPAGFVGHVDTYLRITLRRLGECHAQLAKRAAEDPVWPPEARQALETTHTALAQALHRISAGERAPVWDLPAPVHRAIRDGARELAERERRDWIGNNRDMDEADDLHSYYASRGGEMPEYVRPPPAAEPTDLMMLRVDADGSMHREDDTPT